MRELRVIVTRLSKCRRCFVSWSGTEGSQGGAEEVKGLSPSEVLPLVQRLAGTLPVALHLSKRHCCSEELAAVLPPGSTVHPLEGRPRDLLEQVFDAAYPDGVACSVCGEVKPWNKFVPLPSGNSSDCRTCWNKRMVAGWYATPEAMLRSILWGNVREVLKSVNALRLGDPLPMGFADAGELLAYMRSTDLWERYEALCGAYYASGRDNKLAPSFGRIDPDKGFVPGNVALSTYAETWATRKARRRPTKVPLASKGYFYTGHFWRALWRHAGKTLWHAEFPTEELAIEFCAKAKDTLAATGGLAGYHVLTRANWPKLGWGKAAKEQKLKRMLGSEEPKEGQVREGDGEWTFKLYFRGAGVLLVFGQFLDDLGFFGFCKHCVDNSSIYSHFLQ